MEGRKVSRGKFFRILIFFICYSRLKFGTNIDLELTSKLPIPYFIYTVTSHADIVRMKYIPLPANTKSHIIKIKPAVDMIPRCYVYVHYIINGDLRYCELSLKFPNEFENTVSKTLRKCVKLTRAEVLQCKSLKITSK